MATSIRICVLALALPLFQPARVGDTAFANSGSAAAQPSFLYGLAQLHNFEYDEAARAFREAQQADPRFAMAYWGEAMTKNHPVWMEQDLGGARRILERLASSPALRVATGGTDRERAYLRAVETLYGAGDKATRDVEYLEQMRQLHAAFPGDVDATAFYALALLGSSHDGRDAAVYALAASALEPAFAANPNHPGLAHYLIHSYDDPEHARLGLPAARRYFTMASDAPHALHMTSHIYLAAGMWDEVVAANEQARRVGLERARKAGRVPGGCGHSNMWLMYGYLQQGRADAARGVLDACRASATADNGLVLRAPEQDPLDPDNIPAASYIQMWSRYIIDTQDWSGAVAREDVPLGNLAGARLTRAFVRALAAANRSDQAALATASEEMSAAIRVLEAFLAERPAGRERYQRRATVLEREVRALTLLGRERREEAVVELSAASAIERAMPVEFGPPFVDKPASELLGDVLLALGRREEAAKAYRSALEAAPNRTASVNGLARTR